MQTWLTFVSEFQLTVVLISSPLALLVALLGMTTDRALRQMQSNRRQMGAMRDVLQRGTRRGEALPPPTPTPPL